MGKIEYTNIIVDDFSQAKRNPFNRYVHFLTHIHTDHLKGLSSSWDCGIIYCSHITKKLLLAKFPQLTCVKSLALYEPTNIELGEGLNVCVTLFDANHIRGSVMILFDGYMGKILYSGDFRFNKEVFSTYQMLYPPSLQISQGKYLQCNQHIDVLYLDNTFLDDRFNFPPQEKTIQMIDSFIEDCLKEKKQRIFIGMDLYGKQQVLAHISEKFNTTIVVSESKYETVLYMDYNCQLFTTNTQQGFIEVVKKSQLYEKMKKQQNCAGLVMSGWNNECKYKGKVYYVPYSSHSNFYEIQQFVRSIKPSQIIPIVQSKEDIKDEDIDGKFGQVNYAKWLNNLRQKYTSRDSIERTRLKTDPELPKIIMAKLALNRPVQVINKVELGLNTKIKPPFRKGAKITNERDEEQISKMKKKITKLKTHRTKMAMKKIFPNIKLSQEQSQDVVDIENSFNEDKVDEGKVDEDKRQQFDRKSNNNIIIEDDADNKQEIVKKNNPQNIFLDKDLLIKLKQIRINVQPTKQQIIQLFSLFNYDHNNS